MTNKPTNEKGIFDCTDLEKELNKKGFTAPEWILKTKIEERQRLKAEVEKILDGFTDKESYIYFNKTDRIKLINLGELKKRLGI